ncbi:queuosine precursor transporter [Nitratireductor mangrovi]|uniref:Probable queuosine precursor transporter n=1 Tax=Nitratireductor mangrovi TaxID=2599600 RepID=A0A5B8L5K1_9HYPH|nr:queuosine precursor transporter [Nitratireductor mangrovi]QDZ03013.1 queuosine precursor transporter [Nitratireductor mangrovi]
MTLSRSVLPFVLAMAAVVAASNYLVQFPFAHFGLGELLTWGAFTYPVAFLVNDLTNRRFGPAAARKVVLAGFVLAVFLSVWLATPRIAIASGSAFLAAQLLDIQVFDRLRGQAWWRAPFVSTLIGSVLDTLLFFAIAFAGAFGFIDAAFGMQDGSLAFPVAFLGASVPLWVSLAIGDFCVKILVGLAMLAPYGALLGLLKPADGLGRESA